MERILTKPMEIPSSDVTVLRGHTFEVFSCAWNPDGSLLASVSANSTARIWNVSKNSNSHGPAKWSLRHRNQHDVFQLNEGRDIACYWFLRCTSKENREGELISTMSKHKGPIFSTEWNKNGDYLLTAGADRKAVVWDVRIDECKQEFLFHTECVLGIDWKNNITFASCSADGMIYVCEIGENLPIRRFSGHQIWSMRQEICLLELRAHEKLINLVRWNPTGPGTNNPNKQLILARASLDATIKLWDVDSGHVLHSLDKHKDHIFSISFSPGGEYIARGSEKLYVWSAKEGKIVRTFNGDGKISSVCWNEEGDRLAAGFSGGAVCILDVRM